MSAFLSHFSNCTPPHLSVKGVTHRAINVISLEQNKIICCASLREVLLVCDEERPELNFWFRSNLSPDKANVHRVLPVTATNNGWGC